VPATVEGISTDHAGITMVSRVIIPLYVIATANSVSIIPVRASANSTAACVAVWGINSTALEKK
jgi:hypothetical protein